MEIPRKAWQNYISKLSKINKKAAQIMTDWIDANGYDSIENMIAVANGLTQKYGEASAALACEMYDSIAAASGMAVPPAVPADVMPEEYVAQAVRKTVDQAPTTVPNVVGRMVKQAGADTMLQNARRDGAQFAWIPSGDTCAFCITLASRGWQNMSKKALKNGHAEHIHSNCDCEYAIRFSEKDDVAGYDPQKYEEMYRNADGNTPQEKINAMRRAFAEKQSKSVEEVAKKIAFVPAKTIEEAEKFASNFVDTGGFGSVGLSYAGVNIDVANEINRALDEVYRVFDIPKLNGIAAPAKNTKIGKMVSANAAYSPIRKSLLLDRNKTKSATGMLDSLIADKRAFESIVSNPERYDFSKLSRTVRNVIENGKVSGRATVPETVAEAIWHEMGHHIELVITRDEMTILEQNFYDFGKTVSGYAATNVSEYVAESTAAYMKGEKIKDETMLSIFKRIAKK